MKVLIVGRFIGGWGMLFEGLVGLVWEVGLWVKGLMP